MIVFAFRNPEFFRRAPENWELQEITGPGYFLLFRWLQSSAMWKICSRIYLMSFVAFPLSRIDARTVWRMFLHTNVSNLDDFQFTQQLHWAPRSTNPLSCIACARVLYVRAHASPAWARRRNRSRCLCGCAVTIVSVIDRGDRDRTNGKSKTP